MAWIMHPALGKTTVEDFLDRKNEAADWFDKYRNKKETKEAIDFLSEHF